MVFTLLALSLGLVTGSFFNVLIWRIPREESIVWPASHCPNCSTPLKPWHNIPVLSYLFLRGKCHFCKEPISLQYPLVECATGLMAVIIWHFSILPFLPMPLPELPFTILQSLFLLLLIPIAVIDLKHFIIPDRFTLPFLAIALAVSFIPGPPGPLFSIIGVLAGGGSLYAIGWLGTIVFKKGDAMGGGDIKMMAVAGALWGAQSVLLAIIFGALVGSVYGIGLMVSRKLKDDHHIPFGPFLGCGLLISVFFGEELLYRYLMLINRLAGGN